MGLLSRRAAPLSVALAFVLLAAGCFSELKGDSCASDRECFPNETCIVGSCVERAAEVADVGVDAAEDVGEDVGDEPDVLGEGVGILTGYVVLDENTDIRIPGALITTRQGDFSKLADNDGKYTVEISKLSDTGSNTRDVVARKSGYRQVFFPVIDLTSNRTTIADLLMCEEDNACGGCTDFSPSQIPEEPCTVGACVGFWECEPGGESIICGSLVCE